jgi:hypothetical protein
VRHGKWAAEREFDWEAMALTQRIAVLIERLVEESEVHV